MTKAGNSQIMRTIPSLIAVCFAGLPARSKCSGGIVALSHYFLCLIGDIYMYNQVIRP
jgi:hypothetical protein